MFCKPYRCNMSEDACIRNQLTALKGIEDLKRSHYGRGIAQVLNTTIDRILVCGACELSMIDHAEARAAVFAPIIGVFEKVPEPANEGERGKALKAEKRKRWLKAYRARKKMELKASKGKRDNKKRLERLKRKIGGVE